MSEQSGQFGRFAPIHEAHAIEQVVFSFEIDRPLDGSSFSEILRIATQFKQDLPGQVELQEVAFAIHAPGQPPGVIQPNQPAGTIFRRMGPDGTTENELRIERASVTFRTSLYTRWDNVWSQAFKYFKNLIPIYVSHGIVKGITLHYIDKFVWNGGLPEGKPNLLLRSNSKYLCQHIFDAEDLWHSHTGVFMRPDDYTKRLLNINVDCIFETQSGIPRKIVAIATVLTDIFNQPDYKILTIDNNNALEEFEKRMQSLHVFGKKVFGSIINDEMCKLVALTE